MSTPVSTLSIATKVDTKDLEKFTSTLGTSVKKLHELAAAEKAAGKSGPYTKKLAALANQLKLTEKEFDGIIKSMKEAEVAVNALGTVKSPFTAIAATLPTLRKELKLYKNSMTEALAAQKALSSDSILSGQVLNAKATLKAQDAINASYERQAKLRMDLGVLDPNKVSNASMRAYIKELKLAQIEEAKLKTKYAETAATQKRTTVSSAGVVTTGMTESQITNQSKALGVLRKRLDAVRSSIPKDQYHEFNKILSKSTTQLNAYGTSQSQQIAKASAGVRTLETDTKKSAQSMANWSTQMKYAIGGVARSMGAMTYSYAQLAPLLAGIAVGTLVKDVMSLGAAFEYTAKFVDVLDSSVGGLDSGEIQKALLGLETSRKGPKELALGMKELAKAGDAAAKSLGQIEELARFATIAEVDMAAATKLVVGQSKAFGVEYSDAANMIAAAATSSATTIQELGSSLSYTTELATVSKVQFGEVATAMSILANNAILSSKAGTALRTSVLKLQNPTSKASKMFKDLGLEFSAFSQGGQVKSLRTMFMQLEEATESLADKDRVALLKELFGLRALKGGANILKDITTQWDKQARQILISTGGVTFLQEKYKELNDTVKAQGELLGSDFEKLKLNSFIDAGLSDSLKGTFSNLRDVVTSDITEDMLVGLVGGVGAVGESITGLIATVTSIPSGMATGGLLGYALLGSNPVGQLAALATGVTVMLGELEKFKTESQRIVDAGGDAGIAGSIAISGDRLEDTSSLVGKEFLDYDPTSLNYLKAASESFAAEAGFASQNFKEVEKSVESILNTTNKVDLSSISAQQTKGIEDRQKAVSALTKQLEKAKKEFGAVDEAVINLQKAKLELKIALPDTDNVMKEYYKGAVESLDKALIDSNLTQVVAYDVQIDDAQEKLALLENGYENLIETAKQRPLDGEEWNEFTTLSDKIKTATNNVDNLKSSLAQLKDSQALFDAQSPLLKQLAEMSDEGRTKYDNSLAKLDFKPAIRGLERFSALQNDAIKKAVQLAKTSGVEVGSPAHKNLEEKSLAKTFYEEQVKFSKKTDELSKQSTLTADKYIEYSHGKVIANMEEVLKNSQLTAAERVKAESALADYRIYSANKVSNALYKIDKTDLDNAKRNALERVKIENSSLQSSGKISASDAQKRQIATERSFIKQQQAQVSGQLSGGGLNPAESTAAEQFLTSLGLKYESLGAKIVSINAQTETNFQNLKQELSTLALGFDPSEGAVLGNEVEGIKNTYAERLRLVTEGSKQEVIIEQQKAAAIKNAQDSYNKNIRDEGVEQHAKWLEFNGQKREAELLRLSESYQAFQNKYAGEEELLAQSTANYLTSQRQITQGYVSMAAEMQKGIEGWSGSFASQLNDAVWTADFSFASIAESFGKMITEMLIQLTVAEPLMRALGSFVGNLGFGSSPGPGSSGNVNLGSPTFNAKGNVYSGASISAYSGSVVSQPTFFANGGSVMGEDGHEGIFPLQRNAQGKLGVSADGVGGGETRVIINNYGEEKATVKESRGANNQKIIEVMIGQAVKKAMSDGSMDTSMQQNYGSRRSAR